MQTLSEISTQYVLQKVCHIAKMSALGDFWYEDNDVTKRYIVYQVFVYSCLLLVMILEGLEVIFYTYPKDLHMSSLSIVIVQIFTSLRFISMISNRNKIRALFKFMIEDTKLYEDKKNLLKQCKNIDFWVFMQILSGVMVLLCCLSDGLTPANPNAAKLVFMGFYYPKYEDTSTVALFFRIFLFVVETAFMWISIVSDGLAGICLTVLSYKFVNLKLYYERTYEEYNSDVIKSAEFRKKCEDGAELHYKLIRMANMIDECLSYTLTSQIFQGSCGMVVVLAGSVFAPTMSPPMAILNLAFATGLLAKLGILMINAGDVTYHASLMAEALVHCGWHLSKLYDDDAKAVRRMVLVGCIVAQRPLVITVLGYLHLSHENFTAILRGNYSIIALLKGLESQKG